ncbi:kinase-like domain-containing protein [Biscogniauxia marginata]|nr:kinase-like domain-containing protein [Biscogniauxia marginata]
MTSQVDDIRIQGSPGDSSVERNRQSRSSSYDSLFECSDLQFDFGDLSSSKTPSPRGACKNPCQYNPNYGLKWVRDGLSLRPEWTAKPTTESIIAMLKKTIGPEKIFHVEHMHDGTYSKLYRVSYDQQHFVMRISLPVCSTTQTTSEVATLAWIHQNTNLPVPRVECYDSSQRNPLSFEWILMSQMDGIPLSQCWKETSFGAKERIVQQIAAYAASAFEKQFRGGIGNIYPASPTTPITGPQTERACFDHRRGPFFHASEWTSSRLRLSYSDLMTRMQDLENVGDRRIIERMLALIERVEALEDRFFSSPKSSYQARAADENQKEKTPAPTMLWHDNISLDNILVDENGILCGVLDWQCVSCLPLHEACQFPAFLQQDLKQYETTRLRQLFVKEMVYQCPAFVEAWANSDARDLRDYEAAVQNCDNEFAYDLVESWVEAIEKGCRPDSLGKRLHEQLM